MQNCRTTSYIDNLLNMQLTDHRKFIIRLILTPYFVNVQKLTDTESFSRIKEWALKCNTVKKLEPSISYFDYLVDRSIRRAKEETLQHKNRDLYDLLNHYK
jgi:hypothetical protein